MENFIKDILNPYWWVSVVIVGFVINISAAFIKQRLDNTLNLYSKKRKTKSEEKKLLEIKEINKISKSEFLIIMKSIEEFRERLSTLLYLILAIIFLVFIVIFSLEIIQSKLGMLKQIEFLLLYLCGAFVMFLGMKTIISAAKYRSIVYKALEKADKVKKNEA